MRDSFRRAPFHILVSQNHLELGGNVLKDQAMSVILSNSDVNDIVLLSLLLTLNRFPPCSGVPIVDFKQVIADRECYLNYLIMLIC